MKKHIVCFGDSNTYGYDPRSFFGSQYAAQHRWADLLAQKLSCDVVNAGENGREIPSREGELTRFDLMLANQKPVDLLVIMLGTNDVKERFSASAACVAIGMGRLVKKAIATECWGPNKPNILVIAPPHIGEGMYESVVGPTMGPNCAAKSRELAHYYKEQCDLIVCHFLDAQELGCEFNNIDCMHLTNKGHETLAKALAEKIPQLLK